MNRKDLLAYHDDFTKRMKQICVAKNQDYAGPGADDPFANFRRVEAMGIATTVQGFLTRMTDKLSRLSSFAEAGTLAVKDESALDTCIDLANYSLLLAAYLASAEDDAPLHGPNEKFGIQFKDGSILCFDTAEKRDAHIVNPNMERSVSVLLTPL